MSACRTDKATLVAPVTLRYFVSGVGARYGVVLTSSHRSLRTRCILFAEPIRSESCLARLLRRRKQGARRGRLPIKWHTQVMKLFRPGRFARMASLLAIVILLCVGAFPSLFPTGLDVSAALTTKAHSSHVNQGANGESHPLEGSSLAVRVEEAEDVDKHPVNAELLSALLLLAVSFGATVVWRLSNGRLQGASRSLGIDGRRWFVSALKDSSFLGVFRL
jgi:hypothetical protein